MRLYQMLVIGGLVSACLAGGDALAQGRAEPAKKPPQLGNPWDPPAPPTVQLSNPNNSGAKVVKPSGAGASRTYQYQMSVDDGGKKPPKKK